MKIALASLNQAWEDKSVNQEKCIALVKVAKLYDAGMIIFPEMTLTGFSNNIHTISEHPSDSFTISFFSALASENEISIVFGAVFTSGSKATNNLLFVNEKGELMGNYIKIHPFSYSGEDVYFVGGNDLVEVCYNGTHIGFSICYDLRFPELFQGLSKKCEVIIVIANWPEKRINHWSVLMQARAIENQVFMIGVNRIGTDGNNVDYVASSVIFSPTGEKVEPIFKKQELDIYDFAIDEVKNARKIFPVKKDRKPDLYKTIL